MKQQGRPNRWRALKHGTLDALRLEVARGLSRPQKEISPKFFYDRRGSELFEAITRLPEYYLTRTERALLRDVAVWVRAMAPAALVEPGAGAADKTRILLDAMPTPPHATPVYVPLDISDEFLHRVAADLRSDYPHLRVLPVVADMAAHLPLPPDLPRPSLFALLGSTIGNFRQPEAVRLLRRIRAAMEPDDRLLLGADLVKDSARLEAAYNDAAGVTAAFNLNALRVLNRELGTDFDPDDFRHHAFYSPHQRRIEMHLVARRPVRIHLPDVGPFTLATDESIRTEISCKYDRPSIHQMLDDAGLDLLRWQDGPAPDPDFALVLAGPT
jgi:L-histidine Nalpha-methyltransferase